MNCSLVWRWEERSGGFPYLLAVNPALAAAGSKSFWFISWPPGRHKSQGPWWAATALWVILHFCQGQIRAAPLHLEMCGREM